MASEQIEQVLQVLGGSSVLGRVTKSDDLRRRVRNGLPYRSLESVVRRLRLQPNEIERVLSLPERTRVRRKKSNSLSAVESDRLYRLARIASLALLVLGDEEKASRWLHKSNRSLGDQAPLDLLDTEIGARAVEDSLGRIEHGIFG